MKTTWLAGFASSLLAGVLPNRAIAADSPALKYGLYIHYGIDTFGRAGEKGRLAAERFAPTTVNVKAWAHAAKESGMTFVILTAKHESGFCLWASTDYGYDIAHSPFKGDLIADFIAACKAEGILPGVHYSIPDAYNESAAGFQGQVPPPYFKVIKQHTTELNTKYPELRVFVLDVSSRLSPAQLAELTQIVKHLNPQCAVWPSSKSGEAVPQFVADTVNQDWMWHPGAKMNSSAVLFQQYNQAHAAGKAFVLNVGPGPLGNIADNQLAVLRQLKNLIANPKPDSSAAAAPDAKPDAGERLKKLKALQQQGLITKED